MCMYMCISDLLLLHAPEIFKVLKQNEVQLKVTSQPCNSTYIISNKLAEFISLQVATLVRNMNLLLEQLKHTTAPTTEKE